MLSCPSTILSMVNTKSLRAFFVALTSATFVHAQSTPPPSPGTQVKNVVLVHGALVDASGWRAVYTILTNDGYHVSLVNEPETSFAADVAATRRVLNLQTGPVVLVGHSYGGIIITEAGNDPKVKALVYVAAMQPEVGESGSQLLQSAPAGGPTILSTPDGYLYLDPSRFRKEFGADLPQAETDFMASSQVFISADCFKIPVSVAAWHEKPSYAILPTGDQSLNLNLQRFMYQRGKDKITELSGSHAIYISQPKAVAAVIEAASREAK